MIRSLLGSLYCNVAWIIGSECLPLLMLTLNLGRIPASKPAGALLRSRPSPATKFIHGRRCRRKCGWTWPGDTVAGGNDLVGCAGQTNRRFSASIPMGFNVLQCHLDREGATDLVVDLIINNHSSRIFLETVELGIALLEGGNSAIQVCWRRTFELHPFLFYIPLHALGFSGRSWSVSKATRAASASSRSSTTAWARRRRRSRPRRRWTRATDSVSRRMKRRPRPQRRSSPWPKPVRGITHGDDVTIVCFSRCEAQQLHPDHGTEGAAGRSGGDDLQSVFLAASPALHRGEQILSADVFSPRIRRVTSPQRIRLRRTIVSPINRRKRRRRRKCRRKSLSCSRFYASCSFCARITTKTCRFHYLLLLFSRFNKYIWENVRRF